MADIKVSELTEASAINDSDLFMIVQSGNNKKITKTNAMASKQDTLVSGTNIKTINNTTLLGSGNVDLSPKNSYNTSTTDAYSCDFINDCEVYSTSETLTGKRWIDGKPVYRKIISKTTETSTNVNIPHNIDLSTLGDIVKFESICRQKNQNVWFTGATNNGTDTDRISHYVNGANITLRTTFTLDRIYIILEYTKTTD